MDRRWRRLRIKRTLFAPVDVAAAPFRFSPGRPHRRETRTREIKKRKEKRLESFETCATAGFRPWLTAVTNLVSRWEIFFIHRRNSSVTGIDRSTVRFSLFTRVFRRRRADTWVAWISLSDSHVFRCTRIAYLATLFFSLFVALHFVQNLPSRWKNILKFVCSGQTRVNCVLAEQTFIERRHRLKVLIPNFFISEVPR